MHLKDGTERWLLIHIEVQGNQDSHFAQRMFRYYYRIFDKFEQDIVAIALLTDGSSKFRPAAYHYSLFGTTITYQYNLIKLFDYEEEDLLNSLNPFAIAVLAGKYANEAKRDHQKRYRFKKKLIQLILLETSHYSKEQQRFYLTALLYFINYLLQLPIDLNEKLKNEIILKKEVTDMLYLDRDNPPMTFSEYEKLLKAEARREGEQQGLQQGKKEVALELLQDGMPIQQVAKYVKMSVDEIKRLVKE